GLAALAGALLGWLAWRSAPASPTTDQLRPLVWAVVAAPLAALAASLLSRHSRPGRALVWCGAVYFFSLFAAARLERLLIGDEAAVAGGFALYFQLALAFQAAGGLIFAWRGGSLREAAPQED
ncbi:MAG TPA: hypothetical protein VGE07_28505, partial [Herpetosiphonaceae bacterium]